MLTEEEHMSFQEIQQADGSIEVMVGERRLTCPVCAGTHFHERNSLLNTRAATFFNFDWANKEATNYICAQCGYIFWFMVR
jgi:hypothetical protein